MAARSLSVSNRFLLGTLAVLTFYGLLAGAIWVAQDVRSYRRESETLQETYLAERRQSLRDQVYRTVGLLDFFANRSTESDLQTRQQTAIERLRRVRFGRDGYIWLHDLQPVMVMHPYMRNLEGEPLDEWEDETGKLVFVEMNRIAQTSGEGYLEYRWPKPADDAPIRKLSFVVLYEPWGWVAGAGLYLDDMEASLEALRIALRNRIAKEIALAGALTIVAAMVAFAVSRILARRLGSGMRTLSDRFHLAAATHTAIRTDDLGIAEFETIASYANAVLEERMEIEQQLLQSQKLEAIGQLAGGVAHDFNNLLTAVSGYAALLGQELSGSALLSEYVEEIRTAATRGADLTARLLAFSSRQPTAPEPVDLNRLVLGFRKLLARVIGENAQIDLDLTHERVVIHADRLQIEQVLMNLSVNAKDAMPEGGVITIKTRSIPADASDITSDRPEVELTVADTGVGIDSETQARIFEPFFTTKESRGTGLGLSIVYGIVHRAGGTISCRSSPGRGTTMTIRFPACAELPESQARLDADQAISTGDERILIVEDELSLRELCKAILSMAGYRAKAVSTAREAQEYLCDPAEPNPDLVLSDIVMPGMSGTDLARSIGRDHPEIPVLLMSGYSFDLDTYSIKVIQKPFTPAALTSAVRQAIDSHDDS